MSNVAPGAPSSDPSGHRLPAGEKGSADIAASPFSPRGEGARRADEGAPGATKIIKQDIRKHRPAKTGQARRLRRNGTEEEYYLWSDLRARRLNGYKFARQVPLGPFIVDFLCREERLIVEVDGFQHAESATDQRRTEWLNANGYSVLRLWSQEISRERRSVLETMLAALQGRLEFSPELPGFYSPAAFTNKDRQRS
ncbi:restriction endonuclease type 2-like protein [Rhizobium phaseoli]|uniref:DUF559 domain-containing protein n=1 Tax=Rhizobium phaseoli TaxID=396 RepID=A0A192TCJ3_9HYPH|nr:MULTISPECIES: DUF559 domain-containing protein [Rhizobium]ANL29252.1 restriction endonuclease type 2-like protein [Rhizobium phaseoli]ANL41816.1 restriction endonuclease type 2-like protein [Rhizobium phaseoli]ANL54526.1 restriction endonuclease type 2-like protein [Rhizobium phaseoli]ANL60803.1 restriction endonuclease type 2-like protein [Rhizobium phaseoli]ANL86169.1 restriction endonuclease type 2-like protein [Rhizobium phaseoli]